MHRRTVRVDGRRSSHCRIVPEVADAPRTGAPCRGPAPHYAAPKARNAHDDSETLISGTLTAWLYGLECHRRT